MAPSATTIIPVSSKGEDYASGDPNLALPEDAPTGPPVFSDSYEQRKYLKQRLAMAFRVFAKFGFAEGIAGHITLRDPVDPTNFWVNPFGMHFSLITADDLILVNHAGKVIDGGRNRLLNYGSWWTWGLMRGGERAELTGRSCFCYPFGDTFCEAGC